MGSFGLIDLVGNTFGYSRVIVYGADGKIKFPTGGGGGSGTVTSIGMTVPSAFNVTPSTITTSGTFAITAIGTVSQYIDGTGALQAFPTIPSFTPSALTKTDDTNVTLTLGGTPTTALLQATSLTLGWTGTLATGRGGTGLSTIGTALQYLRVNSAGTALEYATLSVASPLTTKGDIYVRNASADTRLPVGLDTQVLLADSSTTTGLRWGSNTTPPASGYYGAFQDNNTQTASASNTGFPIIFNTTDLSNGVTIVSNGTSLTRITFANTGIYNIQFSVQLQNLANAPHDVEIWVKKNGIDIPATNGVVGLEARKTPSDPYHIVAAWNFVFSIVGGDYYELYWATDNHINVTMPAYAATAFSPTTPSAILTVTQQAGILAGTGITAINSLTGAVQTLATGTTGTDFGISSSGTTHTFNLPVASATNTGKLSSTDWSTFNGKENALTFSSPLSRTVNTISIPAATSSVNGYLTSTDWTNFNTAYTNRITSLTTTGTSGAATLISNVLNIPNYTVSGLGGVPTSRTLTINGTAFDLSADRSWSVGTVTSVSALTLGTSGTDLSSTVATGTTTPVITLNVPTASASNRGALSSTDWTNFNTAYTNRITSITNTGTSGNATISSNILNVPNYSLNDLGRIAVSTANAREDNYAPTGWPGTSDRVKVIAIDSTNTNYMMSLGGLASPSAGRIVTIVNASAANNLIIIENLSTSSTAANRFQMTSNMAYFLLPTRSVTFIYDGTYWTQMSASSPMGLDFFDDCTSGPQNSGAGLTTAYGSFGTSATGTGSSLRAEGDAFGSYGIVTGSTAAGAFYMSIQARRNGGANAFGANSTWPMLAVGRIALVQLGTALQDFTAAFGINGQQTTMNTTVPTGYVWHYPGSANAVWENKSTNATGTTSTVSSPLSASGSFVILGVYKPGGANIRDAVYFYSTDAIIYSFSSKFVGTVGSYGGWVSFGIASTVGTTSKELRIDYAGSSFNFQR